MNTPLDDALVQIRCTSYIYIDAQGIIRVAYNVTFSDITPEQADELLLTFSRLKEEQSVTKKSRGRKAGKK